MANDFAPPDPVTPFTMADRLSRPAYELLLQMYNKLQSLVSFSGDYNDLTNKPTIPVLPVMQTSRTTTGSIANGVTSTITITWATAFADTNYTVVVVSQGTATTDIVVQSLLTKTASSVQVVVKNTGTVSHTGTLHAIAIHD